MEIFSKLKFPTYFFLQLQTKLVFFPLFITHFNYFNLIPITYLISTFQSFNSSNYHQPYYYSTPHKQPNYPTTNYSTTFIKQFKSKQYYPYSNTKFNFTNHNFTNPSNYFNYSKNFYPENSQTASINSKPSCYSKK